VCSRSDIITCRINLPFVQTIYTQKVKAETKEAIYNLFAAYVHTVPLQDLIGMVERARREAQLRYVVIYGAACSYCLARAERLEGLYLRTFALELKEQPAQTLATFVTSILAEPHGRPDKKSDEEPPLRQIIDVLQQVMCARCGETCDFCTRNLRRRFSRRTNFEVMRSRYVYNPIHKGILGGQQKGTLHGSETRTIADPIECLKPL